MNSLPDGSVDEIFDIIVVGDGSRTVVFTFALPVVGTSGALVVGTSGSGAPVVGTFGALVVGTSGAPVVGTFGALVVGTSGPGAPVVGTFGALVVGTSGSGAPVVGTSGALVVGTSGSGAPVVGTSGALVVGNPGLVVVGTSGSLAVGISGSVVVGNSGSIVVCSSGSFVVPKVIRCVTGAVVTLNVYPVATVVRSSSSDITEGSVVRFSVLVGDFGVVLDSIPPGTAGLTVTLTSGGVVNSSSIGSKETTKKSTKAQGVCVELHKSTVMISASKTH